LEGCCAIMIFIMRLGELWVHDIACFASFLLNMAWLAIMC